MILLIEKAIVDEGNEDWQQVIPAPYDTNMVKDCVQPTQIALKLHAH